MNVQRVFPQTRLRRMRQQAWLREMVAEYRLHSSDLIWPVFVVEGQGVREPIASMPDVCRYSIDEAINEIREAAALGICAVALFPVVEADAKSDDAAHAWNSNNLMNRAIAAIKAAVPEIGIIGDVALDPYTSHGQDGLMRDGVILNDETVEALCKQASSMAAAGCDIVAPSDMMDGRVGAIRNVLDAGGYNDTCILSYAAKYASAFYGPFRDAVGSAGNLGTADKRTYQMNPAHSDEALHEVAMDIAEGADMVMVKPGLPYLDIVRRVSAEYELPTFVYHVSGEYAQLKAAAAQGWLDYDACLMEALLSCKRAGASGILTYGARDAAKLL